MRTSAIVFLLLPSIVRSQIAAPAAAPTLDAPLASSTLLSSTPSSTFETIFTAQETDSPIYLSAEPKLDSREIVAGVPAAPVPVQVSPVTEIYVESRLPNGKMTQVLVIYSQTFVSIPDQGPTPVQGKIGLGTLTGSIGVVKTAESSVASRVRWGWGTAIGAAIAAILVFY